MRNKTLSLAAIHRSLLRTAFRPISWRKVLGLGVLILGLSPISTQASVSFFTDRHCQGHHFTRQGGQIADLREITFEYPCLKEYGVAGGEAEILVRGICRESFNDRIRSVRVTQAEEVELFEHLSFRGDSDYFGGSSGCYNLGWMAGEATSLRIYR